MLDTQTRTLVKATAPVLKEHGVALTRHFYARMFEHNPELKAIFNQGHQRSGAQQQALRQLVLGVGVQGDVVAAVVDGQRDAAIREAWFESGRAAYVVFIA